jgi:flagellar hook-associated protein 3 FlgL
MDNVLTVRAKVGARLNALDTQKEISEELILQSEKTLSGIQDLDYAEAISSLNLQLVGLQASQQAFTRIQNLSLFNYL